MTNVAAILEERLSQDQLASLRQVARASASHGAALYLVGGTVRDLLLGHPPADLDLAAADASPELANSLAHDLHADVVATSQFGTSKLAIGDMVVDLVIARRETYARPGALPTVEPGSIEQDLARRDFSINAMAISLAADGWGDLLDPFDGHRDLGRALLRVLHPGSFVDDATRILRAVRYAGRLRLGIEPATERLIRRDLSYLDSIKGDRIRHELQRIFREDGAASILGLAQELGVISAIYAPLRLDGSLLAKLKQIQVRPTLDNDLLFASLLAYSVPPQHRPGLMSRLNMDSRWSNVVRDTGVLRDAFDSVADPDIANSLLYRLLGRLDLAAIRGCALATDDRRVSNSLALFETKLRHVKPALNGNDLIAMGVPEGPAVGKLLDDLLKARLDGVVDTRDDEEALVARRLSRDNH